MFSTRIDITGQRFGRWFVLEYAYNDKGNQAHWRCQCDCGNISVVTGRALRAGLSKSCGCYKSDFTRNQRTIPHKFVGGIEYKRCPSCNKWLELREFSASRGKVDGLSSTCKPCQSAKRKSTPRNKKYFRDWANNKYATDINYRVKSAIQARIRSAVKNNYKAAATAELLGCSIEYLKYHLEFQFKQGMSWDNYGKWHIDHKIPCASFDLSDPEQQKICFHYTNLQPLWMLDNVRKGDKIW